MRLTFSALRAAAVKAGFPEATADTAAAVAIAESGGDTNATNIVTQAQADAWNAAHETGPRHGPERSFGAWQINTLAWPAFQEKLLADVDYNARAAYAVSHNGTHFGAWSTFNDGSYKTHLPSSSSSSSSSDLDALIMAALVALIAVAAKRGLKVPA